MHQPHHHRRWRHRRAAALLGTTVLPLLAATSLAAAEPVSESQKPHWLQAVHKTVYDGTTDDLVTGGLGVTGMTDDAPAPGYADKLHPTAAELRRAALFRRGRASEGFGRLFGPNIDPFTGATFPNDGRIAGEEYLAYADDGDGKQNVAMLLQVPAGFRIDRPCILAMPVNGSASLFRDIVDFGFWGLQRGCAVVSTDKGLGNGVHDLETDTVNLLDGTRAERAKAGTAAHFAAEISDAARQAFLAAYPHRVAFKHAHSKQNPETTWGRDTVRAVQFAFYQLNQKYAATGQPPLTRANTLVIGTGNSNGGGAILYAGEHDTEGWLDAIVAAEPQIQLRPDDRVSVSRGGNAARLGTGRSLLDYFTYAILYQPCAAVATPEAPRRQKLTFAENRCQSLHEKGLLTTDTLEEQGKEALTKLREYGWEPEADVLHASHYDVAPDATASKYASDHGGSGSRTGSAASATPLLTRRAGR